MCKSPASEATQGWHLTHDQAAFEQIVPQFVQDYIKTLARVLHNNPNVAFDLNNVTPEADELLFDICFFGIANFEEQSGFVIDGERYVPFPVFTVRNSEIPRELLVGSASFHALVGDDLIPKALEQAREELRETGEL